MDKGEEECPGPTRGRLLQNLSQKFPVAFHFTTDSEKLPLKGFRVNFIYDWCPDAHPQPRNTWNTRQKTPRSACQRVYLRLWPFCPRTPCSCVLPGHDGQTSLTTSTPCRRLFHQPSGLSHQDRAAQNLHCPVIHVQQTYTQTVYEGLIDWVRLNVPPNEGRTYMCVAINFTSRSRSRSCHQNVLNFRSTTS